MALDTWATTSQVEPALAPSAGDEETEGATGMALAVPLCHEMPAMSSTTQQTDAMAALPMVVNPRSC